MSCEDTPHDRNSVETEDMDEPQVDDVEEETSREGSGTVELQQQALAQLQMPGLGIEFGLELMRQRSEQLEKLPSLAMEGQLPVGPLP